MKVVAAIDLDDIICVIRAFENALNCWRADVFPCNGDGRFDWDDILTILSEFAGNTMCP